MALFYFDVTNIDLKSDMLRYMPTLRIILMKLGYNRKDLYFTLIYLNSEKLMYFMQFMYFASYIAAQYALSCLICHFLIWGCV